MTTPRLSVNLPAMTRQMSPDEKAAHDAWQAAQAVVRQAWADLCWADGHGASNAELERLQAYHDEVHVAERAAFKRYMETN